MTQRKKMVLIIGSLSMLVLLLVLGQKLTVKELPASFSETEVTARAEEILQLINSRDYDAITALTREDLREELNGQDLAGSIDELLNKSKEFDRISSIQLNGTKDRETKEEYASVTVKAVYQNGKYTYTIVLDKNLQLVALAIK